ncbi:MAG: CRISPR-associated protein Cas4 [Chloroflexi bacterium]|nr:CRISPR-associated protein Cas4 [Chloroflexota bacterium]
MSVVVVGLALALVLAGVLILWAARHVRQATGLPVGRVIYADTSAWRRAEEPILSRRWGLVGRPDYLVAHGREVIPVEVKSGRRPNRPYESHLLQLAAYCLLVEEQTGRRPSHGLLCYDDAVVEVPFDHALRQAVLDTLSNMRRALQHGEASRSHKDPARCWACGVRHACDQRLEG